MTSTVLVTGGAGFIGSHVVDRLLAEGETVVALDSLVTGRTQNLEPLAREGLRFVQADVRDLETVTAELRGVDTVYHLAALADIVPSIERPIDYHGANVDGTFAVLEAARAAGVRRVVYAASSSCYGIPDEYPTPETAPISPEYPYAFTKWVGEQYVLHWGKVYGLDVVSLRLFNVYGPRSRTTGAYGAVFGVFLAQMLAGKPLTVVGDGTQVRDFVFVTDIADAFVRAGRSDVAGVVLNVGTGNPQSVNRLVELLGAPSVPVPRRPGEPDRTEADATRIRELLGWEPQVPFEAGVETMLEHIDDWRSAPVWTPDSIEEATRAWFEHLGRGQAVR
jgi:UDP-glucose 4-epimerase